MPDRPHILILMPDQMRADCMSCARHPAVRTPNIDRIATEGVRFEQATTVSPVCMSARASFISGRYPHSHGMWTNRGRLPADALTLFHVLRDAGYFTAHIGKSHYYSHGGRPGEKTHMREYEGYMHARGFDAVHETTGPWATTSMRSYMTDRWEELGLYETFLDDYRMRWDGRREGTHPTTPSPLPVEEHLDSYVGRVATEFVRDHDGDRPLCLFVGFPGPHEPWDAPGDYAAMYDPADLRDPIPRPEAARAAGDRKDFEPTPGLDAPTARRLRANYLGKISLIDHWVGEILAAYEQRRWLDELCVVFWSDHGEMAGDHGRLYKQTFHESSVRVPTLVRAPGRVRTGSTSAALAETVDIA
ncbi:MAG: sulfatase-like hydrolase/transferase, partial [Planctomycetota bacterium]